MEKIAKASQTLEELGWGVSLLLAAVTMGVGIILSVTVNPLFDRSVHWDWMAVIAPVLFVALTLGLRFRKL
jgi:hypothetical protein